MGDAIVVKNEPAGTLLRAVTFDRPLSDHTIPGQWSKVTLGGIEAPFALANTPGEPVLLLAKDLGAAGNALAAATPGAAVPFGPCRGGFPLARIAGKPLVALANGSGISAIRPVIIDEVRAGLPRPVHLLYGVLAPDHVAFNDDLAMWGAAGVHVRICVAEPFVQNVASELGLVRADTGVVMAGVPAMIEAARALWAAAGADPAQLLVNF